MSLFGIGALPVFNAVAGFIGATKQNKANSAANSQTIAWERERAQNAHQWEVEDLRKAGLNPILSAGGSGASTSGVSIIPASNSPLGSGLNNAITAMSIQEQLKGMKEDNALKRQQYDQLDSLMNHFELRRNPDGSVVKDKNGLPIFDQRNLLVEDMKNRIASTALQNSLIDENIKALKHQNFMRSFERDAYDSSYGKYLWGLEKATDVASKVGSAIYGIGSGFKGAPKHYHNSNTYFNYK